MIRTIINLFHSPKPGDIYIEKDNRYNPNPFQEFRAEITEIIETRKGWIRFKTIKGMDCGVITEWEEYIFLYSYKLETRAVL